MTDRSWAAALEELEHQITGHRALLAAGAGHVPGGPAWAPRPDLGPVPEACLPKARVLLRELQEVVEELDQARTRARRERRLARALPSARSYEASYVDVRG